MAAFIILIALFAGLGLGVATATTPFGETLTAIAKPVGGLWLNALKMTVVPLVVALLITGITKTAEAAKAGKLAGRSVLWFLTILWSSSIMAALVLPALLNWWPLDASAGEALKSGLATQDKVGTPPGIGDFLLSLVPSNPIAAAANDAILPLTIFTTLFAFAMLQLSPERRAPLSAFFEAVADVMLVVIGWVLWLAPVGVFALAILIGTQSGFEALGALAHYVILLSSLGVIITLAAYGVAIFGGRVSLLDYQRAVLPAQAVAISTQSSLASLPAMLKGVVKLGVKPETADMVLPLAVALFRASGPALNLGVAIYIAHWFGMELTPLQLAAGVAVAATTTIGAVSLPGTISFISSIAPIAIAMGVPIEPLAILLAVETIPDIFRTFGNVSMDVAVTKAIARQHDGDSPKGETA
jgi:proton glutamate symport protein